MSCCLVLVPTPHLQVEEAVTIEWVCVCVCAYKLEHRTAVNSLRPQAEPRTARKA